MKNLDWKIQHIIVYSILSVIHYIVNDNHHYESLSWEVGIFLTIPALSLVLNVFIFLVFLLLKFLKIIPKENLLKNAATTSLILFTILFSMAMCQTAKDAGWIPRY